MLHTPSTNSLSAPSFHHTFGSVCTRSSPSPPPPTMQRLLVVAIVLVGPRAQEASPSHSLAGPGRRNLLRARLASTANDTTLPSGQPVVTDDEGGAGTDPGLVAGAIVGVIAGAILIYFCLRRWLQRRKLHRQQKQMYKVRVGTVCVCVCVSLKCGIMGEASISVFVSSGCDLLAFHLLLATAPAGRCSVRSPTRPITLPYPYAD